MKCPFCSHEETHVKDSRVNTEENAVRRRRLCPSCGARWTTFERVQLRELDVIKRSGRRVPFDRDKMARSMRTAVAKRPVEPAALDHAIARICRLLEAQGESFVTTGQIGDMVLKVLHTLDDVAFIRYASVYREFTRAEDFARFLAEEDLA